MTIIQLKKEKFLQDLSNEGLSVEKMISLAKERHYCQSMICDLIERDHKNCFEKSGLSRKSLRNLLITLGVKHNNALYLKLQQEIKLQFKYPSSYSLDDIKIATRLQSRQGALKTVSIRKSWEHYSPKNKASYYESRGSSLEAAQQLAHLYRCSKSPHSRSFARYSSITDEEISSLISELARNRGIRGLISMRTGVSKLENRIADAFTLHKIKHERQFPLGKYVYDFMIPEKNLIIEVNGTYWHADPRVFKSNQIINFPYGNIRASEKWHKDKVKIENASKFGYQVKIFWELDVKTEIELNRLVSEIR